MKFLKLRASFGKLHEELELCDGLNLLCLPNEAGKSTWCAFLSAMLYGIDTSERANSANQGLPAKERYKPWDGSPMEGAVDLEWQGRRITIERRTAGRVPMGEFRAYETGSGLAIPELTAENCGNVLCGVERSVFERTAFIRQLGLPVSGDAALEKRLGALVSTGEEGGKSYSELEKELRGIRNRLSGRAGKLPRLTERSEAVQRSLEELRRLQEELPRLAARREEAAQEQARLTELQSRVARAQAAQKRAALQDMAQKINEQALHMQRLQDAVGTLPEEHTLQELRGNLSQAENDLQTAQVEAAFGVAAPARPVSPLFPEMDGAAAKRKAEADAAEYERLRALRRPKRLPLLLLCVAVLLAGGILSFFLLFVGLAVLGVGLVALAAAFLYFARKDAYVRDGEHQAELILARYNGEDIRKAAERYAAELETYAAAVAEADRQKARAEAAVEAARARVADQIAQVARFAPDCQTADGAREAIAAALHAREQLDTERRSLESLRKQYAALEPLLGDMPEAEADPEALRYDTAKLSYELRQAAEKRELFSEQLAALEGKLSAKGDSVALEAEAERLQEALADTQRQCEAVDLALAALHHADETLRARFSPQITAEAGRLLARLTGEKYPHVLLEPNMRLSVREAGEAVMRPAVAMSCGTADQMYLALRLAMCRRLLPEDAPLILDDALVSFDEERAAAALRLLREEAEQRQILLFSCRILA